jgi:hypothetical protein
MKTIYIGAIVGLVVAFAMPSVAQGLKTVAECRAYREAWYTSASDDTKRLSVGELVSRGDKMMRCGREIDAEPIEAGMTAAQATKAAIDASGYALIALNYYREAFNRAAWFIKNKHLTNEFIAEDKDHKIVRPPDASK